MKITRLKVSNIGIISDADIQINKPLLVFYGECRHGKTTLLNAVRWVCGGSFPSDIIKHGAEEASIELGTDTGSVTRSWYRGKDGETKARPVQFVDKGKPVKDPATRLKLMLNPFMLDQDHFRNMNETERKRYLVDQLGVDTVSEDAELVNVQKQATGLRSKIAGYGDLRAEKIDRVNVGEIQHKLAVCRREHEDKVAGARAERQKRMAAYFEEASKAQKAENARIARDAERTSLELGIADTEKQISALQKKLSDMQALLASKPVLPVTPITAPPDYADMDAIISSQPNCGQIETQLTEALAVNVRADANDRVLARIKERTADETALKAMEERGREIKAAKVAKLAKVSEQSGVPGLTFDEDGTFVFEGTQAGMLSTSQVMRLSSLLSALYPEGLGVELLDRAESLGRSVFDYVKHAEARKVSVLATVVGERPANVPEKVGVFVVKDGVVFPEVPNE